MSFNSYEKLYGGRFLSPETVIHTDSDVLKSFIKIFYRNGENIYGNVFFHVGIPDSIIDRINGEFGGVFRHNPEGYCIILDEDIDVYAESETPFAFACADLCRMSDRDFVKQGIVYNIPKKSMRYLKLFTPAEWEIEDFKKIVDYCVYCRCNGIMIEVSGCMEYKKHPEINEKWVEYCSFMMEYSGKTEEIERGFDWNKDSIHVENAQGKFLKQETMKELVDYCAQRGIELIPEVPSLSHCDYLILPYPEIAERKEDPYPDTYCPSNPKSYEILFDVLGEVIDVFKPKHINVGHDEYYSIGLCDKCKQRDPSDIFADDINKINDFLRSHGVTLMFWADKVLDARSNTGHPCGGAEKPIYKNGRYVETIPATYKSIDKISKDVMCINWYFEFGEENIDRKYIDNGFTSVFGNFNPIIMEDLTHRLEHPSVLGGGPSNWSASNLVYMQYNWVLFDLLYGSFVFWKPDYNDDTSYEGILEDMAKDMYHYNFSEILSKPHFEITHTANFFRQANYKHDGNTIDYATDTLGKYVVTYEDGEKLEIPVYYNQNISNKGRKWTRTFAEPLFDYVDFISYGTNYSHSTNYYDFDRLLAASCFGTLPIRYGEDTYFRFDVENPHPDKKVVSFVFEAAEGKDDPVIVKEIRY